MQLTITLLKREQMYRRNHRAAADECLTSLNSIKLLFEASEFCRIPSGTCAHHCVVVRKRYFSFQVLKTAKTASMALSEHELVEDLALLAYCVTTRHSSHSGDLGPELVQCKIRLAMNT